MDRRDNPHARCTKEIPSKPEFMTSLAAMMRRVHSSKSGHTEKLSSQLAQDGMLRKSIAITHMIDSVIDLHRLRPQGPTCVATAHLEIPGYGDHLTKLRVTSAMPSISNAADPRRRSGPASEQPDANILSGIGCVGGL